MIEENADPAPRENLSLVSGGLLSGTDTWLAEQHGELLPRSHLAAHKGRVIGLCRQTTAGNKGWLETHTRKIQLPAPLTWDEPHAAAIQTDCVLRRALPTGDRTCHLPRVHAAQDRWPKPLRHQGMMPRSSRMNRIWPLPCMLPSGVGGPGAHVRPATAAKATAIPRQGLCLQRTASPLTMGFWERFWYL